MHDYLFAILAASICSPLPYIPFYPSIKLTSWYSFQRIVGHGIAWGEYTVKLAENLDSEYIQALLTLGLENLYEIAIAGDSAGISGSELPTCKST